MRTLQQVQEIERARNRPPVSSWLEEWTEEEVIKQLEFPTRYGIRAAYSRSRSSITFLSWVADLLRILEDPLGQDIEDTLSAGGGGSYGLSFFLALAVKYRFQVEVRPYYAHGISLDQSRKNGCCSWSEHQREVRRHGN